MAHSYTRSAGAPTELQHGYDRDQLLKLPPISAYAPENYSPPPQQGNYPPTQGPPQPGHYDSRFQGEGRQPITLPSIHSHAHPPPHPSHDPRHQPQGSSPQHHHPSWHQRSEGFHPYPMDNRPPHLQQSQAQKYATLPSEPYVPSSHRTPHHVEGTSENMGRSFRKITQRRGEKPADHDRGAHDKIHPPSMQSHNSPRTLYTQAPQQRIVSQPQQVPPPPHGHHLSPRSQEAEARARQQWEAERAVHQAHLAHQQHHQDISQVNIRKRSTSGEAPSGPPKMLSPVAIPRLQPYIQGPTASTTGAPAAPKPPSDGWSYELSMRQQPVAARACGFGERDRRVIDPPPILELKVNHPTAVKEMVEQRLRNNYYVVHCSLWGAEEDRDNGAMDGPRLASDGRGDGRDGVGGTRGGGSGQRRLMGTLVASPFVGLDEFGKEGCFFCFPDLSCRTTGRYRLKFNMCLLDPSEMVRGDRRAFVATAMSGIVTVYAAKDFPGMSSSSKLTRRLKEQGCLISVKKGIERVGERKEKAAVKGEDDDDEEEERTPRSNGRS